MEGGQFVRLLGFIIRQYSAGESTKHSSGIVELGAVTVLGGPPQVVEHPEGVRSLVNSALDGCHCQLLHHV